MSARVENKENEARCLNLIEIFIQSLPNPAELLRIWEQLNMSLVENNRNDTGDWVPKRAQSAMEPLHPPGRARPQSLTLIPQYASPQKPPHSEPYPTSRRNDLPFP